MLVKIARFAQDFAQKPHAAMLMFVMAIFEGFILPFPSDLLLVTIILARHRDAQKLALINTAGTVIGGIVGYCIGRYAFGYLADPALTWLCQYNSELCPALFMPQLETMFDKYGVWLIGAAAIAPVLPYKLGILFAGLAKMNFVAFVLVSFAARWLRYATVAFVVYRYGRPALALIEGRLRWVCAGAGAAGLAAYCVVTYL